MATVYLGLGSNLDSPIEQLKLALHTLNHSPGIALEQTSSFYRSKPVGPQDQPDFINAVACIKCELAPHSLLQALQEIELRQGRKRTVRWGARTLDIDILLYDQRVIETPSLCIPHREMTKRAFVLAPLAEINPRLSLPDGKGIQQLLNALPQSDVESLALVNKNGQRPKT